MTAAVAGPTPGTCSISPERAIAVRLPSTFSIARAALANARALNLLSPWISSSVLISSSTIATACLSMVHDAHLARFGRDRRWVHGPVPECARKQLPDFARGLEGVQPLQLAAGQIVGKVGCIRACLFITPMSVRPTRFHAERDYAEAGPSWQETKHEQNIDPRERRHCGIIA